MPTYELCHWAHGNAPARFYVSQLESVRATTLPRPVRITLGASIALREERAYAYPGPPVCGSSVFTLAGMVWPRAFAQEKSGKGSGLQSQVDLVSVYFTVRDDKKRLVNDLAQDSFNVTEEGQPQAIKFFAHHSDVVLNVGVLLDTGTRMSWILGEEAQASALFLKHVVRPTDLGFIVSYASRVEAVQLPTSDIALLERGNRKHWQRASGDWIRR